MIQKYFKAFNENMQNARSVVGMNQRNLDYVYPNNPRSSFDYANNKLLTKETLSKVGVRVPQTYFSVSYFYELKDLKSKLAEYSSFVIKPSSGSGGNGIVVINRFENGSWLSISNKIYTFEMIKKHIADIIFGVYSFGLNDSAIIEERIIQDDRITSLSPSGLADVRMINYKGENIKAMLRIATKESDGKANLHQGGIGVAIDLKNAKTFSAQIKRENILNHPDTDEVLIGVKIPYWKELLDLCTTTAEIIPLGYIGIDIAIGKDGPIVLEVNARPGIEIQNISGEGMLESLESIDKKVFL